MKYNFLQRFKTDFPKPDIFMPIFMTSTVIFAVVDMEDCDLLFSNQTVKRFDHFVKLMNDIIPGVVDMTGVKADTQLIRIFDAIVNPCQFLKAFSHFTALSSHCLQGDIRNGILTQYLV